MQITITTKNVYGNELLYPADETAYKFAKLLSVKTLTQWHINAIKALGYEIVTDNNLPKFTPATN